VIVPTLLLLAAITLKSVATVNAIRWMHRDGARFHRNRLTAEAALARPLRRDELDPLFAANGGSFFPFGAKDYKVRQWRHRRTGLGKAAAALVGITHWTLFRLNHLALLIAAAMVAGTHLPRTGDRTALDIALQVLGLVTLVCLILIIIESVYSYITIGGYGAVFHAHKGVQVGPQALIREFQVLVGTIFLAGVTGFCTVYFVSARLDGFAQFGGVPANPGAGALRLLDCAYVALATMLGLDGPDPVIPQAKILLGLIALHGFALLLAALTSMMTIVAPTMMRAAVETASEPVPPAEVPLRSVDPGAPGEPEPPSEQPGPVAAPTAGRMTGAHAAAFVAGVAATAGALAAWRLRRRGERRG
jgi:hypothetical protein